MSANESIHISDSSSKPCKGDGNKVIKLAYSMIALQNLVSDAEKRRNVSERKLCDLRARLAEVQKEEKGTLKIGFANKCVTPENSRVAELEEQVEASKNEHFNSNKLIDELQEKLAALEEIYEKCDEEYEIFESACFSKIAKLKEKKSRKLQEFDHELWETGTKIDALKKLYSEQSLTLSNKIELLENYEKDRRSLSKITKLGLNVAGDQSKETFKVTLGRSRSLAKEVTSRAGSSARDMSSLVKEVRSQSRSRLHDLRSRSRSRLHDLRSRSRSRPKPKITFYDEKQEKVTYDEKIRLSVDQDIGHLQETLSNLEATMKNSTKSKQLTPKKRRGRTFSSKE